MSLRRRLLLTLAPLFVLGLVAVDAGTYLFLQSYLVGKVDAQLQGLHPVVEQDLHGHPFDGGPPRPPGPQNGLDIPPGTYGAIIDSSGALVGQPKVYVTQGTTSAAQPELDRGLASASYPAPAYLTVPGTGGVSQFRLYIEVDQRDPGDLLVVGIPLDSVTSTLSQLLLLEAVTSAAITLVLLVASWVLVRRGLQPLERMGATARSIAASDLSRRVEPANEATEVGRLGSAINTMLGQLEAGFAEREASEQRMRHFLSDASHELRTPLTSMRGYAELLRRNPDMSDHDVALATRRIEEEAARMGVLVDDLLLLARLDQGRPLERTEVDLSVLVSDACADARAADTGRDINCDAGARVWVIGDDLRLRQVIGNVVRNALVHTPPGTPVEVRVFADGAGGAVEVIDHGAGVPAENAQRIFERFQRTDPYRSRDQGGSGLGLSIAAAIVNAHVGRIVLRPTPGGGATFRVELPLARACAPLTGDSEVRPTTL